MRVLIIEDYEPIRTAVVRGLRESAFAVDAASTGAEGLRNALEHEYDVIVLDLMLPDVDGLRVLTSLRGAGSSSKVLILTARDTVEDRVRGLNLGADDYVLKPFVFEELLARVQALTRRHYSQTTPVVEVGEIAIDTTAKTVRCCGEFVDLTYREYSLLVFLAMREGKVVSRTEIVDSIYANDSEVKSNVVDVYIRNLRKKLACAGSPEMIRTKRRFGYVFSAEAVAT